MHDLQNIFYDKLYYILYNFLYDIRSLCLILRYHILWCYITIYSVYSRFYNIFFANMKIICIYFNLYLLIHINPWSLILRYIFIFSIFKRLICKIGKRFKDEEMHCIWSIWGNAYKWESERLTKTCSATSATRWQTLRTSLLKPAGMVVEGAGECFQAVLVRVARYGTAFLYRGTKGGAGPRPRHRGGGVRFHWSIPCYGSAPRKHLRALNGALISPCSSRWYRRYGKACILERKKKYRYSHPRDDSVCDGGDQWWSQCHLDPTNQPESSRDRRAAGLGADSKTRRGFTGRRVIDGVAGVGSRSGSRMRYSGVPRD